MAYEIVPYAPEFDPQIVQLQTHLWSGDPTRNATYFRWKYVDNPFLDEILIRLALFEGRVVAMRGLLGAMWQVDDVATRRLLPYADDFVVAPEHRNRGVASQITRASVDDAAARGFPFVLSFNAGPVTFINLLAAGWRAAGSYHSVCRNTAWTPRLERLRGRLRQTWWYGPGNAIVHALRPAGPFAHLDRAAPRISRRVSVSREPRPQEMAELVARLPWDGRIRHVRDADYFAWRFRNPLHDYRFLFWDDGHCLQDDKHTSVCPERTNRRRGRLGAPMSRSTGSVSPSFPQSSSGNPLPPLPLDAGLETAGMTVLERSVHGQEPPSSGGVSKGGLRGYLVLQRYVSDRADQGCVNIADWEASDEEVQAGLLETALRYGRFSRTQTWTVSLGEPVRALLRDHTFQHPEPGGVRGQSSGLLVRRLSDVPAHQRWALGSRDLANIADWDLRMLYSMAG